MNKRQSPLYRQRQGQAPYSAADLGLDGSPDCGVDQVTLTEALRAFLRGKDPLTSRTIAHEVVATLVRVAREGDVPALKLIIDRIDGALPQAVKNDGEVKIVLRDLMAERMAKVEE